MEEWADSATFWLEWRGVDTPRATTPEHGQAESARLQMEGKGEPEEESAPPILVSAGSKQNLVDISSSFHRQLQTLFYPLNIFLVLLDFSLLSSSESNTKVTSPSDLRTQIQLQTLRSKPPR